MKDPVEIPMSSLSEDALEGIIKDFILREGTDYGEVEYSLEEKIGQVKVLLDRGEAHIYFDYDTETCTLISQR